MGDQVDMFDIETGNISSCRYITISTKDRSLRLNIPNDNSIQIAWTNNSEKYIRSDYNKIKIDAVEKGYGTTPFMFADNTTHRDYIMSLYTSYKETKDGKALLNFMIDIYNSAINYVQT